MMGWLFAKGKKPVRMKCLICNREISPFTYTCMSCLIRREKKAKQRQLWRDSYMAHAAIPGATVESCAKFADDTVTNWEEIAP